MSKPLLSTVRAGVLAALAASGCWVGGGAAAATHCGLSPEPGHERCVSGLPAQQLAALVQQQRASNWCWAASISIVLGRYGLDVPQEQVVRAWFGSAVNLSVGGSAIAELLNRPWRDRGGRHLQSTAYVMPRWRLQQLLSAPEVLHDLDGGRPLLVGTQRHAQVLVQLVYDRPAGDRRQEAIRPVRAVLLDPASQVGVRTLLPHDREVEFLARVAVQGVDRPQGLHYASAEAVPGE